MLFLDLVLVLGSALLCGPGVGTGFEAGLNTFFHSDGKDCARVTWELGNVCTDTVEHSGCVFVFAEFDEFVYNCVRVDYDHFL